MAAEATSPAIMTRTDDHYFGVAPPTVVGGRICRRKIRLQLQAEQE